MQAIDKTKSNAFTVERALERLEAVGGMEGFVSKKAIEISDFFGAYRIKKEDPFFYGQKRECDSLIFIRIAKLVEELKDGDQLRILEVGAGTSYGGRESDYGAPWLARLVKEVFADKVSVVVCDGKDSASIRAKYLPATKLEIGRWSGKLKTNRLYKTPSSESYDLSKFSFKQPSVLFPTIHPEFEVKFFEIDFRRGAKNYYELSSGFDSSEKFDFIFARHLYRDIERLDRNQRLHTSLEGVLSERGSVLICTDLADLKAVSARYFGDYQKFLTRTAKFLGHWQQETAKISGFLPKILEWT